MRKVWNKVIEDIKQGQAATLKSDPQLQTFLEKRF